MDEENISFFLLLQPLLGNDICQDNLEKKINNYINNNNEISNIEKKMFQLVLYLNPNTDSFKSKINKEFIFNILNYLNKSKKEGIDSKNLFKLMATIFKGESFYEILFQEIDDLFGQESLYLEILLLFLPDKRIEKILSVIKEYITIDKTQTIAFLEKTFANLDLKKIEGFQFLKKILLKFLKDQNNIVQAVQELENGLIKETRNDMLRCPICYDFPKFSIDKEKIINMDYFCRHKEFKYNDESNLKQILEHKFKCSSCEKYLLEANKNYLCSNCKKLICCDCINKHFKDCINLFFISLNDVGILCSDHKEKYNSFCSICKFYLCQKCADEHCHIIDKENINLLLEKNAKTLDDFLKSDTKNNKIILQSIKIILSKKKYNFQLFLLIKNFLNKNIEKGIFKEFYDKDFQQYYAHLINEINKGNLYFLEVLKKIKELYESKELIINMNYNNLMGLGLIMALNEKTNVMNLNQEKFSLLTKYFEKIKAIKTRKIITDLDRKIDLLIINQNEHQILLNSILKSEFLYQTELIKLINRSIADSLIRFLIEKYHDNFNKIDLNLSIYENLKDIYKKDPGTLEKIQKEHKEEITNLLDETSNKIQKGEKDEKINNLKLIFVKPIKINNIEISIEILNLMLSFLFLIKEEGNLAAHPNPSNKNNTTPLNGIDKKLVLPKDKGNNSLEKEKDKIKEYLERQFIKKAFKPKVRANKLFDCLFNKKFKDLIEIDKDKEKEKNEEIEKLFNNLTINDYKEETFKEFKDLIDSIKELEDICDSLSIMKPKIKKKNNQILNEFFSRLNKACQDENYGINILYNIVKIKYENSIFGEKYLFISDCLDSIIETIIKKSNKTINMFKEEKNKMEDYYKIQKSIISMLNQLNEKLKDFNPIDEKKINLDDIIDYINYGKNDDEKITLPENVTFEQIQDIFRELIKTDIEWTGYNKSNLLTSLYLKQNKY